MVATRGIGIPQRDRRRAHRTEVFRQGTWHLATLLDLTSFVKLLDSFSHSIPQRNCPRQFPKL